MNPVKPLPDWIRAGVISVFLLCAAGCDPEPDLYPRFRQACLDALAHPVDTEPSLIRGQDDWLFRRTELTYVCAGRFWGPAAVTANPKAPPEHADPMPAILDFHRQLAARGIELLFVPLPARVEIYPDSILGSEPLVTRRPPPRVSPYLGEFLTELERRGVRVLDVTPLLLTDRSAGDQPLFLHSDPHLTPHAIELVSGELAHELKQRRWYATTARRQMVERRSTIDHAGLMWRQYKDATGEDLGSEQVVVRTIALTTAAGEHALEARSPASPVLVLGDSQARWWRPHQSSFFEQLSFDLGFCVDLMSTSGGGANDARLELVRAAREDPRTLDRLRAVVWYFSASPLANEADGWLELPLPAPAASP